MKPFLFCFILCACHSLSGQADLLPTSNGDIRMTPIQHATLVLEWQGRTIYVDPYGGAGRFQDFSAPDLILITHAHGDHFNRETLLGLDLSGAELIAPKAVTDDLGEIKFNKVTALETNSGITRDGIRIEAVPMYNLPEDETSRHVKGWGNGYVVTIAGTRLYFSGDTEDIPEMRSLRDIDYALVCMNLPYTMTVEQAADAVLEFKPHVVYPYHYRGQNGFSDVDQFKALVNSNPAIEVRLRNWYVE